MITGTDPAQLERLAARSGEAQTLCRLAKQLCNADFAGIAGGDYECEYLYAAECPLAVFDGVTAKSRIKGLREPAILDAVAAQAQFAGHPWEQPIAECDWILIHPVYLSPTAAPVIICVTGRGQQPALHALDDLAAMVAPRVRDFRELMARRDDSMRYQLLARATDDVIWDWDVVAGRMDYNDNLERVLGIDANELQMDPMRWFDYIHPDDVERVRAGNLTMIEGQADTWSAEYRIRRRDGAYARVVEKVSVARDGDGRPLRMMGAITDVTGARDSQEELIKTRQDLESALMQLRRVMNESTDLIITYNQSGQFLDVNEATRRMWGYAPNETVRKRFVDVAHPDDRGKTQHVLELVRKAGRIRQFINRVRDREGNDAYMHWSFVWSEQQQIGLAIGRDVTAKTITLEKLSESEERYRLAYVENPVPMSIYDEETLKYIDVNPAALRKYGYERDEFLSLNVIDLVVPHRREIVRQKLVRNRRGGPRSAEWQHMTKDGARLIIQGWSHPLTMGGRAVRIVVAADITEMRALEEKLHEAQKMEAIGQLAGGVAHDFNNLLTIINGYAALLRQRLDASDSVMDHLNAIEGAGKRAATLTQQLLAFSRRQVLRPRVLNLNDVVAASEPLLGHLVRQNVELAIKLSRDLQPIMADAAQIEQVLMNLVVNARDAMPDGGRLTIETSSIRIDQPRATSRDEIAPGSYVAMSVTDTGIGMTEEVLGRIFEPFFSTKAPHAGSGLGLSTVYGIVKQSGGHILVESEAGRGTSMKVLFPAASEQEILPVAPGAEQSAAAGTNDVQGGAETILLVEDDERVREFTSSVLKELGYTVIQAGSAEEALETLQRNATAIQLLLTDIILPGMDGRALADAIMPLRPAARVLFVSGFTESAIDHRGVLDAGVNYLAKPYEPAQLAGKVRQVLDAPVRPRGVLIVDDERAVRELFKTALKSAGYDIYTAAGPEAAIKQYRSTPLDLVISDLSMPGCAAEECIRQLRTAFPHARMLCVTGATLNVTNEQVCEWGATQLLTKPVAPKILLSTVKSLIG